MHTACSPNEVNPGMAWNWVHHDIPKYCRLHYITEGEFKEKIEAVLPTLPQGKNCTSILLQYRTNKKNVLVKVSVSTNI